MKRNLLRWAGCAALLGAALAMGAPASADSVVVDWDEACLQGIRENKPGPTIVSRLTTIVHTAIYDAWACYDAKAVGSRFGGFLRRPAKERTQANKEKAISYAAFRACLDLFPQPQHATRLRALMTNLGYDPDDVSTDTTTPQGIGNVVAKALLDFRHHDGSNQLGDLHAGAYSDYTGYTPVNTPDEIVDPNRWQPLRVSDGQGGTVVQKYSAPHWGLVTPFAITNLAKLIAPPPALYPSKDYKAQTKKAIKYSATLNDERKMTAEYWADGPASELPPGHWCLVAQFVSQRDAMSLDDDVKMFFLVTNATLDAGIGCWATKRYYDAARPITTVHYLYTGKTIRAWGGPGQGTQDIDGSKWQPYGQPATVVSPPFAEHTSGHSTFSAAAAEVLKLFTGSDKLGMTKVIPAGSSVIEPGITPKQDVTFNFPTFTAAAKHAGISRIYSAIHFMPANLLGQKMGRKVGKDVFKKATAMFNGTWTQ